MNCNLLSNINFLKADKLKDQLKSNPDLIVVGVNSNGINWIAEELDRIGNLKAPLLLLTKGLNIKNNKFTILTERINNITEHLRENKKDHSGRRGLLIMVSKRRKLLNYTKKKNMTEYMELIKDLKIRK